MIKNIYKYLFLFSLLFCMAGTAVAANFETPLPSAINLHIAGSLTINGEPAAAGDEVALFDQSGNIVGSFVVENDGLYGDVSISGAYAAESGGSGAAEGEILNMQVWRAATRTLYSGGDINISTPQEGITIYMPYMEPMLKFEGGSFYLLNIQAD